jgi:mono/diheme cytochrome c family protein
MCHGGDGKGNTPSFPPLAGNQSITMSSPVNAIRMVLNGGTAPGRWMNPRPHGMPPFSHFLKDVEAAAVVTYIRVAWENNGTPVTPAQVNELRKLLPE